MHSCGGVYGVSASQSVSTHVSFRYSRIFRSRSYAQAFCDARARFTLVRAVQRRSCTVDRIHESEQCLEFIEQGDLRIRQCIVGRIQRRCRFMWGVWLTSSCVLQGILQIDPEHRWTPWQALQHPFMTDQPFMGSFTPPPEPREFAPNVHHSQSRHSTPQRTHHLPSMATGVSTQQYVQVSPYAQASQSPFAAGHTGSTHMGDTSNLSHAFMQVDLHSTPRSSGFTGDRSGIPASAFPMLGGSVGHRAVRPAASCPVSYSVLYYRVSCFARSFVFVPSGWLHS